MLPMGNMCGAAHAVDLSTLYLRQKNRDTHSRRDPLILRARRYTRAPRVTPLLESYLGDSHAAAV